MTQTATIRLAQAAGRRRGCVSGSRDERENCHVLPLPSPEKSLCALPNASSEPISGSSNTNNCAREFYSFAELASRWRVSRPALYNILRGHPVIDFAPAPGRRGHKIVSADVVRQIERERERVMR